MIITRLFLLWFCIAIFSNITLSETIPSNSNKSYNEKICSYFMFPPSLGKILPKDDGSSFYYPFLAQNPKKSLFAQNYQWQIYQFTKNQQQAALVGSFYSMSSDGFFVLVKDQIKMIQFDPKNSFCLQGQALVTTYNLKADKTISLEQKETIKDLALVSSDKEGVLFDTKQQKTLQEPFVSLKNIKGMPVFISFADQSFYELAESKDQKDRTALVQKKWSGELIKTIHQFDSDEKLLFSSHQPYLLRYNLKDRYLKLWDLKEKKADKELFVIKVPKNVLLHDHNVQIISEKPFRVVFTPISERRKKQDRQLSLIEPPYGAITVSTALDIATYSSFNVLYQPFRLWLTETGLIKGASTKNLRVYDYDKKHWSAY